MSDHNDNHRRFQRLPFATAISLTDPVTGQAWETRLIDISLKGVLVEATQDWMPDASVHYQAIIRFGNGDFTITMSDIAIVHITEQCIGLECHKIDIESISHLKRLLELNFGDPDLVYREFNMLGQTDDEDTQNPS